MHNIKEPGISSPGSVAGASDKSSSAKRHSILSGNGASGLLLGAAHHHPSPKKSAKRIKGKEGSACSGGDSSNSHKHSGSVDLNTVANVGGGSRSGGTRGTVGFVVM